MHTLWQALCKIEKAEEAEAFFKDLCTPHEVNALQERWRVCQLLSEEKYSYREIHKMTGASLTTIGRVARFLKDEPYKGYQLIQEKLKKETPS